MPKLGYYEIGNWNATCDECGRSFKFSSLKLRWDGAWVDSACWEPRQPQDFQHGIKDDPSVPISRPRILSAGLSTLASGITASSVSLTVATGTGGLFPPVTTGKLLLSLQSVSDPSISEFIYCQAHTAGSASFTSLLRGQLGTTAKAFATGDMIGAILGP